jgi:hypothetical protein
VFNATFNKFSISFICGGKPEYPEKTTITFLFFSFLEFEKRYAENPELAEDLFNKKTKNKSPVKQDVEATL